MSLDLIVVNPPNPIAGCLAVVVPKQKIQFLSEIEKNRINRRFKLRAYLSDHVPLSGGVADVIGRLPYHLVRINEPPLSIYLHHGGDKAIYFDLHADKEGFLEFIEVEVEAQLPSMTFGPARTAINELLDSFQRRVWLPLTIVRIDLLLKGETQPLAHQLILPYANSIEIGPLGGIHQYPAFSSYEAVLREAILSTSPYYRFLCAYRLYEGLNRLRGWLRSVLKELAIEDKLPKDPVVDKNLIVGVGLSESFAKEVRNIGDLWAKFTDLRNRIAHFFLKEDEPPLHFSDGNTYHECSLAGAVLLYHANIAFGELSRFFQEKLSGRLTIGSILPMPQYRDMFVIRSGRKISGEQ